MRKLKIVVSDMHLGAGRPNQGNLLEDFSSDEAFARLLIDLVRQSEAESHEVELILAGDIFEFLQVPVLDTPRMFDPEAFYPPDLYSPSTENASKTKMDLIVAGHPAFFGALRDFVQPASPRRTVTFIKGNHDVNLHWLAVQDVIRDALGCRAAREGCLTFEERRVSREGIYVEHGNQYVERVNRFPDFEEPHDLDHPDELFQPAGSRFVCLFFNAIERRHYWMDGVKPLTAMVWYCFALDLPLAVRALVALLRLAPSLIWGSLPIAKTREAELSGEDLLREIEDPERVAADARHPVTRKELLDRVGVALAPCGSGDPFDPSTLAAVDANRRSIFRDNLALARGDAEQIAQKSRLGEVAEQKRAQERARVVVFGHTHAACIEHLSDGGVYINAGTWTWAADFAGRKLSSWRDLMRHPERYTNKRCLNYVRIDYDEDGTPTGRLERVEEPQPPADTLWDRVLRWLRPM